MPDILKAILGKVERRLRARKRRFPEALVARWAAIENPKSFVRAIRHRGRLSVIAEIKRGSPSSPHLNLRLDPLDCARRYQSAGASALSVLTEEDYFRGSLVDLRIVASGVSLPALRKDFIFDPYQVYESRAAGASAILLIVRMLSRRCLLSLHRLAFKLNLSPLVEVHDERDLEQALSVGARMIGVNNRDLSTLKTDLGVARRILPLIPKSCVRVAESGYSRPAELRDLRGMADAVLIGTAFLKTQQKITQLIAR